MFKKIYEIIGTNNFFSLLKFIPLVFLISILDVIGVTALIPILQLLSGQELKFFTLNINELLKNLDTESILYFLLLFVVIINFFKFILAIINNYFFNETTLNIQIQMQRKILEDYIYGPWFKNLNKNTSEKMRDVNEETAILKTNVILPIFSIFSEFIIVISMVIFLILNADIKLFLMTLVAAFAGLMFFYINKKRLINYGKFRRKYEKNRLKKILETINGLREIKLFNFGKNIIDEFLEVSNNLKKIFLKQGVLLIIPKNLLELIVLILLTMIILYFYKLNMPFENIIGSLAIYVVATYKIIPSFYKMVINIQTIIFAVPTINSLLEVLKEKKTNFNLVNNEKDVNFQSSLKLENISFKYPEIQKMTLEKLNFKINKNCLIGIVGESGSGKSTLMDIISGLVIPESGKIYLDEKEISLYNEKWQEKIGVLNQKIYLFEASIRDNITFFSSKKNKEDRKVLDILKKVNLQKYASSQGCEEIVNEDGINLSGGERQRLGLARSLYQDRDIIILDEPTNNLDKETETVFFETLLKLKKEKTIIVVSHNKDLIKYFDKMYLLKDGRLLEQKK